MISPPVNLPLASFSFISGKYHDFNMQRSFLHFSEWVSGYSFYLLSASSMGGFIKNKLIHFWVINSEL